MTTTTLDRGARRRNRQRTKVLNSIPEGTVKEQQDVVNRLWVSTGSKRELHMLAWVVLEEGATLPGRTGRQSRRIVLNGLGYMNRNWRGRGIIREQYLMRRFAIAGTWVIALALIVLFYVWLGHSGIEWIADRLPASWTTS